MAWFYQPLPLGGNSDAAAADPFSNAQQRNADDHRLRNQPLITAANLLLTTLAVVAVAAAVVPGPHFSIGRPTWLPADTSCSTPKTLIQDAQAPFNTPHHVAPSGLWTVSDTTKGAPQGLLDVVVVADTTVLRSPTYQQGKSQPEVAALPVGNLLLTTLAGQPEVAPFVPTLSQGVDRVREQSETSRGTPKTLEQAPFSVAVAAAVDARRAVSDTTRGTPKPLIQDAQLPVFVAPYFGPNEPRLASRQVVDTSRGTPKGLIEDAQFPARVPHHTSPDRVRAVTDTTRGTPKALTEDAQLPFRVLAQTPPDATRPVVDTSVKQPITLQVIVPPAPVAVAPHHAPIRFWWQPQDSSAGTPKPLYADAQLPFVVLAQTAPDRSRPVVDTSQRQPITLQTVLQPIPVGTVVPHFLPYRFWWQPLDGSAGTPKGLYADAQLPFPAMQQVPPDSVRPVTDTSQSTPVPYIPPYIEPPVILPPEALAEMYGGGAYQKGKKKKREHDAPLEVMVKTLMLDPKVKESLVKALPKSIQRDLPETELATLEQLVNKIEVASEAVYAKVERMYAAQVEEEEDDLWMLLLL